MRSFKYLALLTAILICTQNSSAQVDCSITLKEAQKQYDKGVIEKVPSMLEACLKSGFNKEEKLQALKLLTLTYLFEDKQLFAEETMMKILRIDPEYEVNPAVDPVEFINLHNSFRTEAIYTFGISGGLNFSSVVKIEDFGVNNVGGDSLGSYFQNGSGFQLSASFSRHIMQGLSVNIELMYMARKLKFHDLYLYEFASVEVIESQSWLALPLSLSYSFLRTKKLQPYVQFGYVPSVLLSAKSSVTRTYEDNSLPSVTGAEVDVLQLRDSPNSVSMGIGAKYKVNKGHFSLNVQYLRGLQNQTDASNRYTNPQLIYKYFYTDGDFYVDNIAISLGYSYSLYNPKLKSKGKKQ